MDRMATLARGWRNDEHRATARQSVGLPGRLVWKDARGTLRFNSVVIRDISETGAYVESVSGSAIPLYRLVSLQAEREVDVEQLPVCLRQGRVLSAVFRVGPSSRSTGTPEGYGLRLLTEPNRRGSARPMMAPALAVATA